MASKNIKGITIEINGNTEPLEKSLNSVNRKLHDTQYQLRETEKLLKLNPNNTELLAQKQELLSRAIQNTSDKLKALNIAKEQFGDYSKLTDEDKDKYHALNIEIARCTNQLDDFNNRVNGTSVAFDDTTQNALSFADVLKANILSDVILSGLQAIANGIEKIANAYVDAIKTGIEYNATMESYITSFSAMLGSADEAEKAIKSIQQSASASPFNTADLVKANQLLLTTGETAERSAQVINALGDAVAYTGGGNDELTRMAQNLQQIKNVGKASSTDIKQFAMAGIDVYGILADYLGKNIEQIKEMDISYSDLSDALIKASEENGKYFGAMETQSRTLNGQLNKLNSTAEMVAGTLASSITDGIQNNYLPAINNFLTALQTAFSEQGLQGFGIAFQDGIGAVIDSLGNEETLQKMFDASQQLFDSVTGAFDSNTEIGRANIEKLRQTCLNIATKLVEFVTKNWDKFVAVGLQIASAIINGISTAVGNYLASLTGDIGSALQSASKSRHTGYGSLGYDSLGYGYQSGGFASGGITLNASFSVNGSLNEATAKQFASMMADQINEELGRRIR